MFIQTFDSQERNNNLDGSISESLAELNSEQHGLLWELLGSAFNTHLATHFAGEELIGPGADGDSSSEHALVMILKLVLCYSQTLKHNKEDQERPAVQIVHDNLAKFIGKILKGI